MNKLIHKIFCNALQVISSLFGTFVLFTILFTKLDKTIFDFDIKNRQFITDYVNNFVLVIVVFIFLLFWFLKIYNFEKNIKRRTFYRLLLCANTILLFAQIFLAYHTFFVAGNDVFNIRTAAINFISGNLDEFFNMAYFQMCPNNIMAYMIYILGYFLGDAIGINGNYILISFNILGANIAALLVALSTFKITNNYKVSWLSYVLSVIMFGLSPWIGIPYTDSFSIAVPITTIYIYISLRNKQIPFVVKWICIMFLPVISYGLKPLNIIVLIAIFICEIIFFESKKIDFRKLLSFIIAFLLVGFIYIGLNTIIENYIGYVEDSDKKFGLTWVLFLGSDNRTYGMWSSDNYDFAIQYDTQEERQEAMLEKVLERVSKMGINGYLLHCMNKIHVFYNDAHFGWTTACNYVNEMPERNGAISNYMRNIFYPTEEYHFLENYPGYGNYFQEYTIIKQAVWLCVLVLMMICFFKPTIDKRVMILKTIWIGVFLFSIFFETHARILFSYLPLFCLIAGVGATKNK